jgi:hypothetical protein
MMAPSTETSTDELLKALADARRRFVLYYLRRNGPQATVAELATHVAAWEADTTVADVSDDLVKNVRTSLHHVHLPKLDDTNVVEWTNEHVRLDGGNETVSQCLEIVAEFDL